MYCVPADKAVLCVNLVRRAECRVNDLYQVVEVNKVEVNNLFT